MSLALLLIPEHGGVPEVMGGPHIWRLETPAGTNSFLQLTYDALDAEVRRCPSGL